MQRQKL